VEDIRRHHSGSICTEGVETQSTAASVLTIGLRALKRVHDVIEATTVKFWYDSEWLSKPVPGDLDLVLAEYSFKIPLQLRWAADQRLISVEILLGPLC